MKGFKVFNPDWTCRGFQYEVGQIYEMEGKPICCKSGFHFCKNLIDCFSYYSFDPNNKIAEIETLGEIDSERGKSCTNKIHIAREVSWNEALERINTGKGNTGFSNSGDRNSGNYNSGNCNSGNYNSGNYNSGDWNNGYRNSGDRNSGNCNSGDWNSGYRNSGDRNSGNWNSGYCNSGDWNSGDRNSGNYNSGNYNSGDRNSGNCNSGNYNSGNYNSGNYNSGNYNSGDWNTADYSGGCFNTIEQNIYLFNKPSSWGYKTWANSFAKHILDTMPITDLHWVDEGNMTDEEKKDHPEAETTEGYLRETKIFCEERQNWWRDLPEDEKDIIKSIPNFDAQIFKEITGIDVNI